MHCKNSKYVNRLVKIGVILMLKQNYLVKLKYIDTKIIYLLSISPLCQHKQHQ